MAYPYIMKLLNILEKRFDCLKKKLKSLNTNVSGLTHAVFNWNDQLAAPDELTAPSVTDGVLDSTGVMASFDEEPLEENRVLNVDPTFILEVSFDSFPSRWSTPTARLIKYMLSVHTPRG